MSKKIIKAQDKIIERYSKNGLEQINLEKKDIKSITSKIKDVNLNQNKVFDKKNSSLNVPEKQKRKIKTTDDYLLDKKNFNSNSNTIDFTNTTSLDNSNNSTNENTYKDVAKNINNTSSKDISENIKSDMAYNKENLKNTYDGQFRTNNQILSIAKTSNKKIREFDTSRLKNDHKINKLNIEKNNFKLKKMIRIMH